MSKCLIVRYYNILTPEKEVNIWCYTILNSREKGRGGGSGRGGGWECIFDTTIFLPHGTGANMWCKIFSLQIRRWKFDAIIHLPLCKGVTISCYNIITPRGRKFIAGVNISQLYFHPGVVILWGWRLNLTPARTSPTLHPPSPPTVHQLSRLAL